MADPIVETKPAASTVTTLDSSGNELPSQSGLADIFDKIESGKSEGKTTKEVIEALPPEPAPAPETEVKPEEKKEEPKPEEKKEETQPEVKPEPSELEKRLGLIKEEKKPEDKPAEPVVEEKKGVVKLKDGTEIPEDELRVMPHDSPKTEKRIQGLLRKIDLVSEAEATTKKELAARDEKLKSLNEELAKVKTVDPKTQEAIDQQLKELKMYQRRYELDKDPDVKKKFDDRITSSEDTITATLKQNGAGEALLTMIKEEGGWDKFTRSNRAVTLNDGTKTTAGALADQIMAQFPLGTRKQIESAMIEQIGTARDKDRYFKEQQEEASKYFEKKEAEVKKQSEAQAEQIKQIQKDIDSWVENETKTTDWLKEVPVTDQTPAEKKKELEENNLFTRQINQLLRKSLQTRSVQDALQITKDHVQMFVERRQKERLAAENAELKKQLEAKQKDIDKFHSASRSTPRSNSTLASRSGDETLPVKVPRSLEETLDGLASGKLSRSEILTSAPEE